MSELDELIRQRKEIDRKIKVLQSMERKVDGAWLKKNGEYWTVALQEIDDRQMLNKHDWQYKRLVTAPTRDDAVKGLKIMIDTLTELYGKILQEG